LKTLKSRKEFAEIRKKGKKIVSNIAVAYAMLGDETKIGIITSKRLGSAVKRNRIRRRIKEAINKVISNFNNVSIVLMPSNNVEQLNFVDLTAKIDSIIRMAVARG